MDPEHALFSLELAKVNAIVDIRKVNVGLPQILFRGRSYKVDWISQPSPGAATESAAITFKSIEEDDSGSAKIGGIVELSDDTRFKNPVHPGTCLFTEMECEFPCFSYLLPGCPACHTAHSRFRL